MIESQQTICTWADSTFGPASDASIAARALKEMAELVTACVNGEPAERIGEEIADVVIVLARLGRSLGFDVVVRASRSLPASTYPTTAYVAVDVSHAAQYLAAVLVSLLSGSKPLLGSVAEVFRVIARDLAIDLLAAIDRKMAINRARRWKIDGRGHGQHVKDGQ